MANQLRARIENETFQLPGGLEIALTASIGVAVFPIDARTESQLVAAADAAVYEAKNEDAIASGVSPPQVRTRTFSGVRRAPRLCDALLSERKGQLRISYFTPENLQLEASGSGLVSGITDTSLRDQVPLGCADRVTRSHQR